jgi:hypothetical protein
MPPTGLPASPDFFGVQFASPLASMTPWNHLLRRLRAAPSRLARQSCG